MVIVCDLNLDDLDGTEWCDCAETEDIKPQRRLIGWDFLTIAAVYHQAVIEARAEAWQQIVEMFAARANYVHDQQARQIEAEGISSDADLLAAMTET